MLSTTRRVMALMLLTASLALGTTAGTGVDADAAAGPHANGFTTLSPRLREKVPDLCNLIP
jgi:hypothetical protein